MCAHTGFCPVMPNAKAWNKMFYDLGVGPLITLLFYMLVVRLSDYQRRQYLKRSLERHDKAFREDCIEIMLLVADGSYSAEVPETLIEQDKFRDYCKQKVMPDQDRWDEFQNNPDEHYLREFITRIKIFVKN